MFAVRRRRRDGRLRRTKPITSGRTIERLLPSFDAEEAAVTSHLDARVQEQLAGLLRSVGGSPGVDDPTVEDCAGGDI